MSTFNQRGIASPYSQFATYLAGGFTTGWRDIAEIVDDRVNEFRVSDLPPPPGYESLFGSGL